MAKFRVAFVSGATTTYKEFEDGTVAKTAATSAIQDRHIRVAAVWVANGDSWDLVEVYSRR